MKNVLPFEQSLAGNTQLIGTVILIEDDRVKVRTELGLLTAKCSASCLLTPQEGDLVHLLRDSQHVYILSVLEKNQPESMVLNLPGDVSLKSKRLDLSADETLAFQGQKIEATATEGVFKFGVLKQLAHKMSWIADRLDMTANRLHRQAKREHILVEQQHERVSETKNLQVGRFLQRVHKQWISRSERTTLTAKKEVKIDGKRIDLG